MSIVKEEDLLKRQERYNALYSPRSLNTINAKQ